MRTMLLLAMTAFVCVCSLSAHAAAPKKSEATITSDELEIRDNGSQTFFRGHVILKDDPYLLHADQMTRTKQTGIVHAHGHLDGTWLSEKGEKVKAYGDEGEYDSTVPKTQLWGAHSELIRWETSADTQPVHIVADRFEALHTQREFYAIGHVVITQDPKILSRSDFAQYSQKDQLITLSGPSRVFIHLADAKGMGDFTGDKACLTLKPKTAHMEGHVVGHVDPSKTL